MSMGCSASVNLWLWAVLGFELSVAVGYSGPTVNSGYRLSWLRVICAIYYKYYGQQTRFKFNL